MWKDIILSLGPSVLEAIGSKLIDDETKVKVNNRLNEIIRIQFECFADTSLDSNDFYTLIKSTHFIEIIRNYFFMIRDNLSVEEYQLNIVTLICDKCKSAKITDVKEFIKKVEVLYTDFLHKIIEDYPGIYASFQLMSISHREIISKIRDNQIELKRYLSILSNRKATISDENIKLYHTVTEKEYGEIRFTGIVGAERRKSQNINEFYVENSFSYFGKEFERLGEYNYEDVEIIRLKNFFDLGNKIILIGGAGYGKSTTLNYLFCNYEKLYDAKALKLKIDLKEYAEEIGKKKKSILWCIANEFGKRIMYSGQTTEDLQTIVAERLNLGSCLVILDALDEIPTQALRNTVRNEIETFTSLYYLNRFIISTREAGYLKNKFDKTFLHIRINKFNPEQIKKYSRNWYISNCEDETKFDEFWNRFEDEVKRARCQNLIGNPIILVLALVIFNFESSLPTRRIEFYQKCIDTFLVERENRKAAFKLSDKTKSILAMNLTVPKIAFYRYNKLMENSGFKFNYSELEQSIKEAISVEDEINWATAVKQYAEYLVERTELIQEIDENHLDFAHKTFYEYFLAFYFCKMFDNAELVRLLGEWIGDPNNDELARLIVEVVIQNNEPKQHDNIINCIFEMLSQKNNESEGKGPDVQDVFAVISDLYTHNLLQPKYQFNYHKFVLYNPGIVDYIYFNYRYRKIKNNLVLYDPKIIGDLFLADYQNGRLIEVIDSIYYLNNEFKKNIIPFDTSNLLYHINELFLALRKNKNSKIVTSVISYFIEDGIEYTLKYPQIFIAVVSLSIKINMSLPIEYLLRYDFSPRNVFYKYTSPEILFTLIDNAMISNTSFALFLALSIDCAYKMTNSVYFFGMRNVIRYINNESRVKILEKFFVNLWKALNESDSIEEFKGYVKNINLYDSKFDYIYEKTYNNYSKNEKGVYDEGIRKHIQKRSEETALS